MTQMIPLAKLRLSPINVRTVSEDKLLIPSIAADITARGILQNLLATPARKPRGTFEVFDGGRRLRALNLLAQQGAIDAASFEVPVKVMKAGVAELCETSLAASFHQLKLTPAEECRAFQHFISTDGDIDAVAKRFGQTRRFVEGRLRLAGLAESVFEALAAGQITLDMAKAYPQTYQPGQTLEVARAVSEIGLTRGSYEVVSVDAKGRVELKIGNRTIRFDPQKINPLDKRDALGLTQREEIKLHANDQIRWTQNDKERGLHNAALAKVMAVGENGITVETADKTVLDLKAGDPMLERLGLAYALNMHMAQGVTTDKAIAVMSSSESNLSNQRLFNVTVTRVRDDLTLHTDNKERLMAAVERNEGNKTSSLETVGRLDIDGKGPTGASGGEKPFNPEPPPPDRSDSMNLGALRVPVEPRPPDLPFPEKDISLEL